MYSTPKIADDLAILFERELKKEAIEKQASDVSIAIESLSKAAFLLDKINIHDASEAITIVLEDFTNVSR